MHIDYTCIIAIFQDDQLFFANCASALAQINWKRMDIGKLEK